MKIKIRKKNDGYEVYRFVGNRWKYWLPEPYDCVRGEHLYRPYRTVEAAKKAAIAEKKRLDSEKDLILEI